MQNEVTSSCCVGTKNKKPKLYYTWFNNQKTQNYSTHSVDCSQPVVFFLFRMCSPVVPSPSSSSSTLNRRAGQKKASAARKLSNSRLCSTTLKTGQFRMIRRQCFTDTSCRRRSRFWANFAPNSQELIRRKSTRVSIACLRMKITKYFRYTLYREEKEHLGQPVNFRMQLFHTWDVHGILKAFDVGHFKVFLWIRLPLDFQFKC